MTNEEKAYAARQILAVRGFKEITEEFEITLAKQVLAATNLEQVSELISAAKGVKRLTGLLHSLASNTEEK